MTAFYRSVAAMTLLYGAPDHAILESSGCQLVIHALRGEPDPPRGACGEVTVRHDSYLKICLPVAAIAAARATATSLGGALLPPAAEWEARGFRACAGHDPKGNVFQVREPAS